jgi:hypothetical protein
MNLFSGETQKRTVIFAGSCRVVAVLTIIFDLFEQLQEKIISSSSSALEASTFEINLLVKIK